MTALQLAASPWAQRAVLAFVFLNTLLFGFSDLWILVAACAGAVMLLRQPQVWRDTLPTGTLWVALAFAWVFIIKLISALWAIQPAIAVGNAFNHLHFLLWPLLLPVLSRSRLSPFAAEPWLALSFLGLLAFWAAVLWLWPASEQAYRFGGGWGSAGMLANVLVFFLLWIFSALTRPEAHGRAGQKMLLVVAFAAGVLVLLGTKGRAEQVILILGVIVILGWRLRELLAWRLALWGGLALTITLAMTLGLNSDRFAEVVPEVASYLKGGEARRASLNTSMGGRMEMYRMALEAIVDRPRLGWGAGVRPDHLPQYATDTSNPLSYSNFHNLFLQILLEIGVLGSVLTLAMMGWLLRLTMLAPMKNGDPEVVLLIVILWVTYALKSLLNATFGYGLPNGVFVFFTAWFWLFSSKFSVSHASKVR